VDSNVLTNTINKMKRISSFVIIVLTILFANACQKTDLDAVPLPDGEVLK
jgi:hypothetical protein